MKTIIILSLFVISSLSHADNSVSNAHMKVKLDLLTLSSALSMFHMDNDRLPSEKEGLDILIKNSALSKPDTYYKEGYMKKTTYWSLGQ